MVVSSSSPQLIAIFIKRTVIYKYYWHFSFICGTFMFIFMTLWTITIFSLFFLHPRFFWEGKNYLRRPVRFLCFVFCFVSYLIKFKKILIEDSNRHFFRYRKKSRRTDNMNLFLTLGFEPQFSNFKFNIFIHPYRVLGFYSI